MKPKLNNRLIIVVGFIVWAGLFVLLNCLAAKTNQRLDFTRNRQHSLSSSTIELLKEIKEPVALTGFYVGIAPKYLEDLFQEYERQSHGIISTEVIDPIANLAYAAKFGSVIKGSEQKVFVESHGQRREINFTDRVLSQNDINNALMALAREARQACFLAGHGEADPYNNKEEGMNTFTKNLLANNILVKTVVLGVDKDIADKCDVLVIAGPKEQLRKDEEKEINEFLTSGGDVLFLIENVTITTPDKPLSPEEFNKNPSLNNVLNNWGLKVNDDIVLDLDSHASGDVGSPATRNYMSFRSVVDELDYTFFIRPRSISALPSRRNTIKVSPFILTQSSEKSWGETNRNLEVKFDSISDRPGPVPIGFIAYEPKVAGEKSDTRIILITDSDFLTNAYITYYNNALLGLKVVNWLTESDYKTFVDEEKIKVDRLTLTSMQKRVVVAVLFLVPLFVLIGGVVFTFKRY